MVHYLMEVHEIQRLKMEFKDLDAFSITMDVDWASDFVIETMRQTGLDMSHRYKETSMGGLAVNVVECISACRVLP